MYIVYIVFSRRLFSPISSCFHEPIVAILDTTVIVLVLQVKFSGLFEIDDAFQSQIRSTTFGKNYNRDR